MSFKFWKFVSWRRVFFLRFAIEDITCNHPYGKRARRFLRLIYTRYRVAVYPVFRSTACRYKRRQLLLAASPVHPGVSLRVITMVCGLSSWLQVQYHFHNDTYPSPASAGPFALSRSSRRKKKKGFPMNPRRSEGDVRRKREKEKRNKEQVENKILVERERGKKRERWERWRDKKYNQALRCVTQFNEWTVGTLVWLGP